MTVIYHMTSKEEEFHDHVSYNTAALSVGHGLTWTSDETSYLLQVWGEDFINAQLLICIHIKFSDFVVMGTSSTVS